MEETVFCGGYEIKVIKILEYEYRSFEVPPKGACRQVL